MTVSAATQIPKPSDFAVFQRQCKVLFEHVLKDPTVKEFGSSGQKQSGIDLLGRRRAVSLQHWVGIQCKLAIKAAKLKKSVVRDEATKALAVQPPLVEFIIVTTASDDGALDAEAALITSEQAKLGRDFTVQVWGWETLQTHILQYEPAIHAFSPDAFPHLQHLQKGQDKLLEQGDRLEGGQGIIMTMLGQLQRSHDAAVLGNASDGSFVDTLLDQEIDQYRDLLTKGRPQTALGLLENLWSRLPANSDGRIRFRVRANLAACKLRLGEDHNAGELYLEAYEFAPSEPKAAAFKVLGLLLLGRPDDAYDFGKSQLGGNSNQAPLIAYLIMVAKQIPAVRDPFAIITPELQDDASVLVAKVDYLRTRGDRNEWRRLAQQAQALHPDNDNLICFAAEALIDEACSWSDENARAPLPREMQERVLAATSSLQSLWETRLHSEVAWDDFILSLGANLATGYRILRQFPQARDLIEEGLRHAPTDARLLEIRLLIALEMGDTASAKEALRDLPSSRNTVFARLQVYTNTGEWSAVLSLAEQTDPSTFEPDDRAFFESVVLLARVKLEIEEDVRGSASALLAEHPEQVIVPVVLYEAAAHEGDDIWAAELFRIALDRRETLNSASRAMLARVAERQEDAEVIVDLLDGFIDTSVDSDDLRLLARGFVNAKVRQRALSFVESLPSKLVQTSFYARVIGSVRFNAGALPEAEAAFQTAIAADETDLAAQLGLLNTWLRQDRKDFVANHLQWPAPGSEDTELGVLMELEVGHGEAEVYTRVQA